MLHVLRTDAVIFIYNVSFLAVAKLASDRLASQFLDI